MRDSYKMRTKYIFYKAIMGEINASGPTKRMERRKFHIAVKSIFWTRWQSASCVKR